MIWLEIYYCGIAKKKNPTSRLLINPFHIWEPGNADDIEHRITAQTAFAVRELAVSLWFNKITFEWKEWDWTLLVEALLVQKEKKMKIQSKAGYSEC